MHHVGCMAALNLTWFRAQSLFLIPHLNFGPPCNAEDSGGTEGQNQQ